MTLVNANDPFERTSETVQISVMPIRLDVFLICWQEVDKTTVVHLADETTSETVVDLGFARFLPSLVFLRGKMLFSVRLQIQKASCHVSIIVIVNFEIKWASKRTVGKS